MFETTTVWLLQGSQEWDLYISLTQYRLLVTLFFVLDIEFELKTFSEILQKKDLAPSDVILSIDRLYTALEALESTNGAALLEFYSEFDDSESTFKGINLEDPEDGAVQFSQDRSEIVQSTLM
jgi:hypothetical protein